MKEYTNTWESVDCHLAAPEWFQDCKFGIWTHWGVFSTPAFGNEWYPRNMYNKNYNTYNRKPFYGDPCGEYQHHISTYGDPFTDWPYHNFIEGAKNKDGKFIQFAPILKSNGGNFDPNEWAQLFIDAGAKIAGPVAEHHDGFSMWNSSCNEWNSVVKGPKLDLVGLFEKAYRSKGLKFLVSTHTAFNFTGFYKFVIPQTNLKLQKFYGQMNHLDEECLWFNKEKELIDLYKPDYMWHDFGMKKISDEIKLKYLSYYFNKSIEWNKEVVVSYNDGFNDRSSIHQIERGRTIDIVEPFWLSADTISMSTWSYTNGIKYYSAQVLIHSLIDCVSKNGCLLLNTSPMADGTFPQEQKDILLIIGNWLKIFGEAIYKTRAWIKYGEGPTQISCGTGMEIPIEGKYNDIRFTKSKDNKFLYIIAMGWPINNKMVITTLNSNDFDISSLLNITLLGGDKCIYNQNHTGLVVNLPPHQSNIIGCAIKLSFANNIPLLRCFK